MIEILKSADDVLALKVSGKLLRDQLDRVMELFERSLVERDKTHIFVEVEDFTGLDPAALVDHLPRAAAMLRELDRFGRIAVVADALWIRWATRLESAILPNVHYEVFTSGERDRALAWVEGRSRLPHGPSLSYIATDRPEVFGFELDGRLTAVEMKKLVDRITRLLDSRSGPLRVLGRFRHFGSPEPSALFDADYLQMKLRLLERVERYAVVGGPLWLVGWVALLSPVLKTELRHFTESEEAAAWEWLGARPAGVQPLAD